MNQHSVAPCIDVYQDCISTHCLAHATSATERSGRVASILQNQYIALSNGFDLRLRAGWL